ncbi:MAG TPA: hypothetical protein VK054_03900 [Beutenbergiaceae bacterium]|nr:hypothetical protein [Beutenbergiaceae bacterium]
MTPPTRERRKSPGLVAGVLLLLALPVGAALATTHYWPITAAAAAVFALWIGARTRDL